MWGAATSFREFDAFFPGHCTHVVLKKSRQNTTYKRKKRNFNIILGYTIFWAKLIRTLNYKKTR